MRKLVKLRKTSIIVGFISFLVGCASFALLIPKQEVKSEEPKPTPIVAEKLSPTSTVPVEPGPEYNYGEVSYYDRTYCEEHNPECITASGEKFNDEDFTCACSYRYQIGSILRFSYQESSVVARCNDRGSFERYGRVADLSKKAFEALAPLSKGILRVKVEEVE